MERQPPATAAPRQQWTVLSLVEWSARHLQEKGFDEARLHVDLLLAHVLGLSRVGLYTSFDRPLDPSELARFKELFKRRLAREPLQYILGWTEFMGMRFAVDRRALIPRPETEHLVEAAVGWARSRPDPSLRMLDIGTGAGNIAIAVARLLPGARITALDADSGALALAAANAESNAAPGIRFVEGDIFGEVLAGEQFDAVLSNPPYVPLAEWEGLQPEVRDFEPRMATTDGADGLRFLRRIASFAAQRLVPGGMLFMEIGHGQAGEAAALTREAGLLGVQIAPDYQGIPRVLSGSRGDA
jgi:release factor glutamine methyltransferase